MDREVLSSNYALLLFATMADDSENCQNLASKERSKVIIIGAGIAGVGAGCYLANHGFHDFIILEATNRIGGRIHTVDLGES